MFAKRLVVVLMVVGLFTPFASSAIVVITNEYTLEEVMDMPNGFRVEDKVFSDWFFTDASQNGGFAPTPAGIKVVGVYLDLDGNGQLDPTIDEIGLCFTGGWSAFANQIADTVIGFKVTADDPFFLVDNTLKMIAFGTDGTGMASISENVYADDNFSELIGYKFVYDHEGGTKHEDHLDYYRPYKEIWVIKDVLVNGTGNGEAHISHFCNTFSQVPEPMTLALLGIGGIGVLLRRRRK